MPENYYNFNTGNMDTQVEPLSLDFGSNIQNQVFNPVKPLDFNVEQSMWDKTKDFASDFDYGGALNTASQLGNLWGGFENLKMAKQSLGMKKEQHAQWKEDIKTRDKRRADLAKIRW